MTKELKMQPMVNDDNPIRKKVFNDKSKSVQYYTHDLTHKNEIVVKFAGGSFNIVHLDSSHFAVVKNELVVKQGRIYEFIIETVLREVLQMCCWNIRV